MGTGGLAGQALWLDLPDALATTAAGASQTSPAAASACKCLVMAWSPRLQSPVGYRQRSFQAGRTRPAAAASVPKRPRTPAPNNKGRAAARLLGRNMALDVLPAAANCLIHPERFGAALWRQPVKWTPPP